MWWKNDIVVQLTRIANALEAQLDLTAEDAAVKKAMGDVKRAEQNIPPRIKPERNKPDAS